jgi:DNA invertase Pin-like site-specific DNA recombinase
MRVALYLRVSTSEQTVANQRDELQRVAASKGWAITHEFADEGISGAKGREHRPAFDQLLKGATRREFDLVAAWSVDRLGRSVQDLVAMLSELRANDCGLYLHRQAVDTTTPSGRALFQMLGIFAEFEREMIRERVLAGLARARAQGKRIGGSAPIPAAVEARVRELLAEGKGIHAVRKLAGCGAGTVQRIKRDLVR